MDAMSANLCAYNFACRVLALVGKGPEQMVPMWAL
jgi:hypothetical protein